MVAGTSPARAAIQEESTLPSGEVAAYRSEFHLTQAEAERRLYLIRSARNIVGDAMSQLGSRYAGVWLDQRTGRFKVGQVQGTPTLAVAAVAREAGVSGDVDGVQVKSTWAELVRAQSRIESRLERLGLEDHTRLGILSSSNSVLLEVDRKASARERVAILGAANNSNVAVTTRTIESAPVTPDQCSLPFCDAPLRGGVGINAPDEGCTAGFNTLWGNSPYVVTAGHCAGYHTPWTTFDEGARIEHSIGPSGGSGSWYVGAGLGDAGMINASASIYAGTWSSLVVAWGNGPDPNYPIHGRGWSYESLPMCHEGGKTAQQCGWVTALNVDITYDDCPGPFCGLRVYGLTESTACGARGDSGGPVIALNGAYGVWAAGGSGCPDPLGFYEEILKAESQIGFTTLYG